MKDLVRERSSRKSPNTLKESENKLALALAASHMGVWEWNAQTDAVFWSPECNEITGVEKFGGTLASFTSLLHPEDVPRLFEAVSRLSTDSPMFQMEFRIIRPSGQVAWLSDLGRSYFDDGGRLIRVLGTVQDVTERKTVENELQSYREKLEEAVAERTAELEVRSRNLEDANAALRALLTVRDEDTRVVAERISSNVRTLVLPYMDRLRANATEEQQTLIAMLEQNLREIVSPFIRAVAHLGFTRRETEIANLITAGKTTKEIANVLRLSPRSVERHRYNIRRKMDLNNKNASLYHHLSSRAK